MSAAAEQLAFDHAALPAAFLTRWRAVATDSVAGEVCIEANGTWWLVVRVGGRGAYAFCFREDLERCADELAALTHQRPPWFEEPHA